MTGTMLSSDGISGITLCSAGRARTEIELKNRPRGAAPLEQHVGQDAFPRVVAAAIRSRDGVIYSLPPPARHHDVGRHMIEQGHPTPFPSGSAQGFLLSNGEFSSRIAARTCAIANQQLLTRAGKTDALYSEDVW